MISGVGHAWSVIKGRKTGNPREAENYLSSMDPVQRMLRNRSESIDKSRLKSKAKKFGSPLRRKR